jgi:hypothetical protein
MIREPDAPHEGSRRGGAPATSRAPTAAAAPALWALAVFCALALALAACGSARVEPSSGRSAAPTLTLSARTLQQRLPPTPGAVQTGGRPGAASTGGQSPAGAAATGRAGHIDTTLAVAKATYRNEIRGPKLLEQLGRLAHDRVLLETLARGDLAGARAEANAQLNSPLNHTAHVTRIGVVRGARVLLNATVNGNGVFVVAPGARVLRLHGRTLGTLLVSIQDVIGFAKLVHNLTHAQVLVRGASGQVRTSPGALARLPLPASGQTTIAGRRYLVRSFGETGWGGERLTVWVLEGA